MYISAVDVWFTKFCMSANWVQKLSQIKSQYEKLLNLSNKLTANQWKTPQIKKGKSSGNKIKAPGNLCNQ